MMPNASAARRVLAQPRLAAGAVALILGARQDPPANAPPVATQPAATQPAAAMAGLPAAWFGTWRGEAQAIAPGGHVGGRFGMALEIGPDADPSRPAGAPPVYAWAITYEQGEQRQTRPYLLRLAADEQGNARPGHFVLDERNGIFVDQFLVGEVMEGHFIVSAAGGRTSILHSRYELTTAPDGRPAIRVEIATYDGDEARQSAVGDGGVQSRRLLRVQRALLVKQ